MHPLRSMFDHMAWADARVLDVLAAHREVADVSSLLRLLSHVVAAERIWLSRLRGEATSADPVWPEWTPEQAGAVARDNAVAYHALLADLSDQAGGRLVEYGRREGAALRASVVDILSHVALHGSYHRGQIATALRARGVTPVNTDFITFVRERATVTD